MDERKAIAQYLEQQAAEANARAEQLAAALAENETVLNALPELRKGAEGFSALGAGVFTNVSITDDATVLVNLGAGVLAEYSAQQAEDMLKKAQENLRQELEKLSAMMNKIRSDYAKIMGQ